MYPMGKQRIPSTQAHPTFKEGQGNAILSCDRRGETETKWFTEEISQPVQKQWGLCGLGEYYLQNVSQINAVCFPLYYSLLQNAL